MCCRFWLLKPFPFERFSDLWSSCPRSLAGLGFWIRAWCFPSLLIGNHQTWRRFFLICEVHDTTSMFPTKLSPPTSYMTYLPTYLPIYQSLINQSINLSTYLSLSTYVYSWISIYIYSYMRTYLRFTVIILQLCMPSSDSCRPAWSHWGWAQDSQTQ